jgi:hypothetical protein
MVTDQPSTRKEKEIPLSNDELTQSLIEGLEVAAQAKANPPDPKDAAETFGQLITDQLSRGK